MQIVKIECALVVILPPVPGIFSDYPAPVACATDADGRRELALARRGMSFGH